MKIQGTKIRGLKLYSSAATVEPDSYFNLVSLLLPGNGTNGAQNNTFLDSSTNNFTVTRNGNTTQGTFSPFSQTGWSNYFNGSSQLVITSTSAAFDISGDFTVECWILGNDIDGQVLAIEQNTSPEYAAVQVQLSSNVYILNISQTGSSWAISQNTGVTNPNNSWNHIAVTRSGTSVKMFLNGTSIFSTTVSGALYSSGARSIINGRFGTAYFTGYVSNFRFVNGAALYTSNFTPPTEPLTTTSQGATAAQVELLTCQSNRFIDSSDNNFTITVSGTPEVLAVAPFNPTAAYSAATVGGSAYFDGSGDYLTVPDSASFDLPGDFTVEFFAYATGSNVRRWFQLGDYRAGQNGLLIYSASFSSIVVYVNDSVIITGPTLVPYQWVHVACVRQGAGSNNLKLYVNGSLAGQVTNTTSFTGVAGNGISLGAEYGGSFAATFETYMSNVRLVKGTAVYTSVFTPPTAPLTDISNTQLLVNYTNAGITDATAKNVLETVGGAAISTAQSKFGGSSMLFDGTGDGLSLPANQNISLGTGDFTIEMWVNGANSSSPVGGSFPRLFTLGTAQGTGCIEVYNSSSTGITVAISAGTNITFAGGTLLNSTWNHFAITRSGTSLKAFVNGTQVGSTNTNSTNLNLAASTQSWIGSISASAGNFTGYIDDFRITRGYARYTANFTPPTAAFPTQ